VQDHLGPSSRIAKALPGFRARPEQIAMAEAVEEALLEGRHLVVEAGTGVGKSFAYLVPALLGLGGGSGGLAPHSAQRDGGPTVVATRTIALQEQLVTRDIPFLLKALDLPGIGVALAKGRSNYVCRRRLEMAFEEAKGLFEDPRRLEELGRIREWAAESRDGTLADLPFKPDPDVWELARAESGNCLHQACPFFAQCAYQRAKKRLYSADLIVANHALVFADLALKAAGVKVLPDYDAIILDEAHELEDGAQEHFGALVSPIGVQRLLGRFTGVRRRAGLFERVEAPQEVRMLAEEVRDAVKRLFASVDAVRGAASEKRLRAPGEFDDPLSGLLERLVQALRGIHGTIYDHGLALEWKSRTDRLEETLGAVQLIHGHLDGDLVYWIEGSGRSRHSVLRAAPAEVAPVLRKALFSRVKRVVLTSATLQVDGSFDHFNRRVGLTEPMERALGSPFDFRTQCRLLLYPRLPDPREPSYDDAAIGAIRALVNESAGGAFVLFTSYRALVKAHDALRDELGARGLHVLRQGAGVRHSDIVKAFAQRGDNVLFATDTFWQGVDVRGQNLRLVILTRLPFAVPEHPLQQAKVERIEAEGGDAFRDYSLPQAVLKLRQGFGRLIRTHEDKGVVAILDPRIRTKAYGKTFLKSLPDCAVEDR